MARPKKKDRETKALAKLLTDLTQNDPNISDIGIILATLGTEDLNALEALWRSAGSLDEFLGSVIPRADVSLVVAAVRAAAGYDYEEVEQVYRRIPRTGSNGTVEITEVPAEKKVRKKHAKPNDALLKFLLVNRLPQYFSDSKRIEINKKSIEIKGTTEAEIRKFAGDLVKIIDSEFVETEND